MELGKILHYRMPQKGKVVKDTAVSGHFEPLFKGDYKISVVGDTKTCYSEMAKYNVNELIPLHESISVRYGREALLEVLVLLSEHIKIKESKPDLVNFLLDMNLKGAGGHGVNYNKGDYLRKETDKFITAFSFPLLTLTNEPCLFVVTQKEEVRAIEKDSRTYQFYNANFHIATAVINYSFDKEIKNSCFKLPFALGYSPEYDSNRLMSRFFQDGQEPIKMFNWDGEKYDRSLPEFIMRLVYQIKAIFYKTANVDESHIKALQVVEEIMCCRIHVLPDGGVILVRNGNPSGVFATTTNNSVAQLLVWAIMIFLYNEQNPEDIVDFISFIKDTGWLCLGDDGTLAIHTEQQMRLCSAVPTLWKRVTGKNCESEFVAVEDSVFLGKKHFRFAGNWYNYNPDASRSAFGLLSKAPKDIDMTGKRAQRLLGVWQTIKFLHLHHNKRKIEAYQLLLKIEEILENFLERNKLDEAVFLVYNRDKTLINSLLVNEYSAGTSKTGAEYLH